MALIDKASLLMVPSTYEAGKLYNVLPSGNRAPDSTDQNSGYDQTRADFDFDRGSNAAATRVNAAGLIEKYRENLLLQSNNFDTTWIKNNGSSFASGKEGYDKTNNAWQFNVATTTNSAAYQQFSFSGVGTFSAYFKKGTIDKVAFANFAGSAYECWFDLTNGTIGQQTGDLIDAKIEAVGTDGWYRCSITDLNNGNSYFQLKPSNAFSTASTAGHIFIQNAQLETGLVATDVLTSGATTAKSGVLVDLPRINYDANGNNGALLLEPSRQQLIQFSEYFAGWQSNTNITRTSNYILSPDGAKNATRLQFTANGFCSNKTQSLASYTLSCYAKRNDSGTQNVGFFTNGSGSVNSAWAVTSEWKRFSYTFPALNAGAMGIAGVSGADISVYGFQIEGLASYATSYIPNHGTSGGVTRAADSCLSSSISTSTDFSIIFEAKDFCLINGSAGGSYANIQFVFSPTGGPYDSGGSYHIYANELYYFNGSTNTTFGVIFNSQTDSKFALVKRGNKGIIYANGVKKTEITLPSGADAKVINWDTIDLTQSLQDAQGDVFGSNYKQLIKFNEALSDSELATLTTL